MIQAKLMMILIFASALLGAVAHLISKSFQDYILSFSKFRETPLGEKCLPAFENKVAAATKAVAAWDVRKKLAEMKKVCDIAAVSSILLIVIAGAVCSSLKVRQPNFVFAPLFYVFMTALFGRLCFIWTFNHKQVMRGLAIYFGCGMGIFLLFVVLLSLALSLKDPQFPAALISGSSHDLFFLVLFLAMFIVTFVALYAGAWLVLGSPVAVSGASLWVASRSAAFIVRGYSEHTLIYIATAARVVSWVMPLISLLLTTLLALTGKDWLLKLLSASH